MPQRYGSIQVQYEQTDERGRGRKNSSNGGGGGYDDDSMSIDTITFPSRGIFGLLGGALLIVMWFAYSGTKNGTRSNNVYTVPALTSATPDLKRYYKHQLVDHFGGSRTTYTQRFCEDRTFFEGPGHPIFVIIGGENPVENVTYPWISRYLAKTFGGLTLCVEHRFYGESQPVDPNLVTNEDFRSLLHPRQALADAVRLIRHEQRASGCGSRGSPDYCPVVTIGGSYQGFLSVLMRTVYPDVVDIGYGSSAPLHIWSHTVSDEAFFDKVTAVAEASSPGCAQAVKEALTDFQKTLLASDRKTGDEAVDIGVCLETIPNYINNPGILQQEVVMVIAEHFAENNMDYYPPGPDQDLVQGCQIFQNDGLSLYEKISSFLRMREGFEECFDLVSELPPGPDGTISASDWSGVGGDHSGYIWDFQSCTLIPECGFGPNSMFPPRQWTLTWLTEHCQRRFGYTPHLSALVAVFGFEDLSNDSYIIFTNGNNDGWSVASVTANVSETIVTFNLPNGAHRSDLTHNGPTDQDTPDIVDVRNRIEELMEEWLDEIMHRDA